MATVHIPTPPSRRRRGLLAGAMLALLFALYAGALTWFAHRVQSDVQRSIHDVPVAEDYNHRSD